MSFIKKIAFFVVVSFMSMPFSYANYNNADDTTGSDDTRSFHLYNDLEMNSSVHFQYGKPRIVIKAIYPELQGDTHEEAIGSLNQSIQQLVKDEGKKFRERVVQLHSEANNLPKTKLNNTFYIDYSSISGTIGRNFILSLRFSLQGNIVGMAHPYHYHYVINYDLNTKQTLQLSDLFKPGADYLSILSTYSRQELSKRLDNKDMIQKGTEPTEDNFKLWNFAPTGLLITFEEYQVAPYVNGAQTVLIPYAVLSDLIPNDSPLYKCVSKKRICMQNLVKTGGFIDEVS